MVTGIDKVIARTTRSETYHRARYDTKNKHAIIDTLVEARTVVNNSWGEYTSKIWSNGRNTLQ